MFRCSLLSLLVCFSFIFASLNIVYGCRPEVCRRRREVRQRNGVLLRLRGCTGQTKPWVRQVAFCLGRNTAEIALYMKDWYAVTYRRCSQPHVGVKLHADYIGIKDPNCGLRSTMCQDVRRGTNETVDISYCINCFMDELQHAQFLQGLNISINEISECVEQFVPASLTTELPVFESRVVTSRTASGRVRLPRMRPGNFWWALTVRLPCRPPLFQFWNAYCINAFVNDVRAREFVLAQNRLIIGSEIAFIATFSDTCRFGVDDIEIVWDKSIPSFAAPQMSSFPSAFPPPPVQTGNIYFDPRAALRLQQTDFPNPRHKRSPGQNEEDDGLASIGMSMPCKIRNFEVTDRNGYSYQVKSKGRRYVIEPTTHHKIGRYRLLRNDVETFNFTLDFGYPESGCSFSSNEPALEIDPPRTWLDANDPITCYTCQNAASERECKSLGNEKLCQAGEVCQSEVRQIGTNKVSITKTCKQADACMNNWVNNNKYQCKPGHQASVCRCCCDRELCNRDALHCT